MKRRPVPPTHHLKTAIRKIDAIVWKLHDEQLAAYIAYVLVVSQETLHILSTQVTAVDCVAPQGSVLAMRPLIVHASRKSQVENPRRVLHIEYAASAVIGDGFALAIA